MTKLLILEDDIAFARILNNFLTKKGFEVSLSTNLKDANTSIQKQQFDLYLLDYRLPDGTGLDLLETIRSQTKNGHVVIMTGFHDVRTVVRAMKMGAADYITKPVNPDELLMIFKHLLAKTDQKAPTNKTASKQTKYVKGTSTKAAKLQEFIKLVAPTDMSVIIQGESGTGKEYVARAIHDASKRASKPFVPIDCGVLSRDLAAGELFGYVKGAFTGALIDKKGQFETASGGTLFLDEIGNLSYEVQIKLLRAIQEKVIQPVGSDQLIPVDIRLIVATNENLMESVREGEFREDLYHRINEFKIFVPPLREREEDMQLFVEFFVREANNDLTRDVERLAPEALQMFQNYDWPGNLRELRNTIRRMVLLSTGREANTELLPEEMLHSMATVKSNPGHETDLKAIQELTEKEQIAKVLQDARGNKSKAARLLNIDRKTLYNKMDKYGLN